MTRVLLVGECNPYLQGRLPLYHLPRGASGDRLREHLGLHDATYARLEKTHLCPRRWDLRQAVARAEAIAPTLASDGRDWDVVVLLGAKVRRASDGPPPFTFVWRGGTALVGLPHPSGRNLRWNEPAARLLAR